MNWSLSYNCPTIAQCPSAARACNTAYLALRMLALYWALLYPLVIKSSKISFPSSIAFQPPFILFRRSRGHHDAIIELVGLNKIKKQQRRPISTAVRVHYVRGGQKKRKEKKRPILAVRPCKGLQTKGILQKFQRTTKTMSIRKESEKSVGGRGSKRHLFLTDVGRRLLVAISTFAQCMNDYYLFLEKLLWCRSSVGSNRCINNHDLTFTTAVTPPSLPSSHGVCADWTVLYFHMDNKSFTRTMATSPLRLKEALWCELLVHLPRRHISVPSIHEHELKIVFL